MDHLQKLWKLKRFLVRSPLNWNCPQLYKQYIYIYIHKYFNKHREGKKKKDSLERNKKKEGKVIEEKSEKMETKNENKQNIYVYTREEDKDKKINGK